MKDTLNLVGDGDDLDIIRDVERTFGIKLTDAEAEGTLMGGSIVRAAGAQQRAFELDDVDPLRRETHDAPHAEPQLIRRGLVILI
jgi:hypothetical protein